VCLYLTIFVCYYVIIRPPDGVAVAARNFGGTKPIPRSHKKFLGFQAVVREVRGALSAFDSR
jgi:hypothetical protein